MDILGVVPEKKQSKKTLIVSRIEKNLLLSRSSVVDVIGLTCNQWRCA